jgi:hypothetical protein
MEHLKLVAIGVVMATWSGISWGQNNCGNQAAPPTIASTAIVSPNALNASGDVGNTPGSWNPDFARLELNGIEYVAGDAVRIQLLTDGCTDIKQVQIGSSVMTPATPYSGTGGNYHWYHSIDTQNDSTGHGYLIWVGYPVLADGSTEQVSVTVVRSGGTGTAEYQFPIVHVRQVQPRFADAASGYSGTEIYNTFADSLLKTFGPSNSITVNGTRIYNYNPKDLSLYIDGTGIWFSFSFNVDISCQPRVKLTGTFIIETNSNTNGKPPLTVNWVNPLAINHDYTVCEIEASVIQNFLHYFSTGAIPGYPAGTGSVQQTLTAKIESALNSNSLPLDSIRGFLDGATTQTDQLLINFKLQASSVEIDVPYDAFDMSRTATRLPPNQVIALVASGLGMRDSVAGGTAQSTLSSGPDGVPLHAHASFPFELAVTRNGPLVDSGAQVAQLLAEFPTRQIVPTGTTDFRYTAVCALTGPPSGPLTGAPQIQLGVNDTKSDAQRLRSLDALGYSVRLFFGLPFGVPGTACTSSYSAPVNR